MSNQSKYPNRCHAQIDLSALAHNARVLRVIWGERGEGRALMGVVKADAYGHGMTEVVETLFDQVEMFAVAGLLEAQQVRQVLGARTKDIFLLGPVLPNERVAVVDNGFIAAVSSAEEAQALGDAGETKGVAARVHVAIDTGMGRIGIGESEFKEELKKISALEYLSVEGLFSHFSCADEQGEAVTMSQIEGFKEATAEFRECFPQAKCIHIANSAGLLRYAKYLDFTTLARPGLALYGVAPNGCEQQGLKPVLSLKTQISLLRQLPAGQGISYGRAYITEREPVTAVATLSAGYGDGYLRQLSGGDAEVLIAGQRCPVLGTVTMDQIMVDVTNLARPANLGDEVVLIGVQGDGVDKLEVPVKELAEKAGTNPWHVFTGISKRVDRYYC